MNTRELQILVFIYQGLMALFATFLEPYLTDFVINQMLIVGNLLLTAVKSREASHAARWKNLGC